MTASVKVFVARLAGLGVFDPLGDKIGIVRDVVVVLRHGRDAPRVLGLVVEIQAHRRVFVAMTRVTSMESGQIILSRGTLSVQRFERRPGETLVLGELLDRKVTVLDSGQPVSVVDAAIEQTRMKDWLLTRVAVRRGGGLSRRRGELLQLDWDEVTGFVLPEAEQGAANMLAVFEKLRPADLASVMNDLSDKRRNEVAAALDDERLADVLEEMTEDDQVEILSALKTERAADVLEAMSPDDAADLIAELPEAEASKLLELMEPEDAAGLRRLMSYSDDTAGGLMTTEPVVLRPDATVAEALARVRSPELTTALASQVYVCRPPSDTPTGRYLGMVHIQKLLREPPSALVSSIVATDIDPVGPECSLGDLTRHLAAYNLVATPVVDPEGRLIGAVTVDDVLDHLLPADWREEGHRPDSAVTAGGAGGGEA